MSLREGADNGEARALERPDVGAAEMRTKIMLVSLMLSNGDGRLWCRVITVDRWSEFQTNISSDDGPSLKMNEIMEEIDDWRKVSFVDEVIDHLGTAFPGQPNLD